MRFTKSTVTVGRGRVSSARETENGTRFIVDNDGALVVRTIPHGSRQPLFSGGETVSFADDCFELDNGRVERRGGIYYVPY